MNSPPSLPEQIQLCFVIQLKKSNQIKLQHDKAKVLLMKPYSLFTFLFFFAFSVLNTLFANAPLVDTPADVAVDTDGFRTIESTTAAMHIKIDGVLNEPAWQHAAFQSHFVQREPNIGEPATERTEVALLRDQHFLYIGVKCYDSEPEKIIARQMRRDARMDDDDQFQIVFDTYRDRRNGYYFVINPNGCRRDASFGDEGKSYNSDWDGIWQAAAKVNEKGWFAEIAIPWKTLRFAESDTATWGANFSRSIRRKNEQVFWQLVPRDAGRMGLFRLSQAGSIVGLSGMKAGGNLEVKPYLLGGVAKDASTDFHVKNVQNFGIDAKVNLSSNVAMNLTWNTDFAQVEADQEQINLTRFSLYFPEKRDFFLDGAETFNFGGQSISGRRGSGNGIRLFYSRRIGIEDGNQQPLLYGVKLFGKAGKFQTGVLNVMTEAMTATADDEQQFYPASNFTVIRLRRELLHRSSVGFMLLNKEQINSEHYNRSGGFDIHLPLTDRFTVSGAVAATYGPDAVEDDEIIKMDEKNKAGSIEIAYDSDLWDAQFSHLNIQDNFNAEMGYVRRTNIKNSEAEIEFSPRPKHLPSIRQFRFRLRGNYMTDQNNVMQESEVSPNFGIRFQNGAFIYSGWSIQNEYIDEDWEVRPGFIIPSANYVSQRLFVFVSTDESRAFSGGMMASYGGYYTGKRLLLRPRLQMSQSKHLSTELDVSFNYVSLPEGDFHAQTFGCRLYYYFSTKFYVKAYVQLNDDRLSNDGDRISLANLLLRWTFRPGSDIYLVYNDRRLFGASKGQVANRTIMAKATFFWRK